MFGRNQLSDKDMLKAVNQRLMRTGSAAQARVTASVTKGVVTIVGRLQYPNQRAPIMKAVQGVPGVGRIIDQMVLVEKRPHQKETRPVEARRPAAADSSAAEAPEARIAEVNAADANVADPNADDPARE